MSCSDNRGNARKPSVLVLQVFVVFIFTFGAQYFHEFVENVFKKFIGTLVKIKVYNYPTVSFDLTVRF